VQNLNNDWRFQPDPQKTGLQNGFAKSTFDDTTWKLISATEQWQKQGFPDYHGPAWYRKTFDAPQTDDDDPQGVNLQRILLLFGGVDGDAVVYLNGEKIGEHLLEPNFRGWDEPFVFDITPKLKPTQNVIAVQVSKNSPTLASGIWQGVSLQVDEQ
jgi:beta-galactosidase/beta-glucuronidase